MGLLDIFSSGDRPASSPIEGALRNAIVGMVIGAVVSGLSKAGLDPTQIETVRVGLEAAVGAAIAGSATLIGKILRNFLVSKGGVWAIVARFVPLG